MKIVTCRDGLTLDPYQVWREVRSKIQAETFLREQYRKQGNIHNFTNWLSCQDFYVNLYSGPRGSLKVGEIKIEAIFIAKGKHRKTLWSFGWFSDYFDTIWSQEFNVTISSSGTITLIESTETVE